MLKGDLKLKCLLMEMNVKSLLNDKNVVQNLLIPYFIFELSTILFDWLMTSFCLQRVKRTYEMYFILKGKSTQIFKLHQFGVSGQL